MDERLWDTVRGGLIVSCQALDGNPMNHPGIIAALAYNAQLGGARGIRVSGPENARAVKRIVNVPVFDCHKKVYPGSEVYITPTFAEARESAAAGADVIVVDATDRMRPNDESLAGLIERIHEELKRPVMADVSTSDEGLRAAELGADAVATTLSGYTPYSRQSAEPDLALVEELSRRLTIPVIAEGRYRTPELALRALQAGAWAVVVGGAITNPCAITQRFVTRMSEGRCTHA